MYTVVSSSSLTTIAFTPSPGMKSDYITPFVRSLVATAVMLLLRKVCTAHRHFTVPHPSSLPPRACRVIASLHSAHVLLSQPSASRCISTPQRCIAVFTKEDFTPLWDASFPVSSEMHFRRHEGHQRAEEAALGHVDQPPSRPSRCRGSTLPQAATASCTSRWRRERGDVVKGDVTSRDCLFGMLCSAGEYWGRVMASGFNDVTKAVCLEKRPKHVKADGRIRGGVMAVRHNQSPTAWSLLYFPLTFCLHLAAEPRRSPLNKPYHPHHDELSIW